MQKGSAIAVEDPPGELRLSWPDWVLRQVDAFPGPTWVVYAVFLAVVSLVSHIVGWATGGIEPGTVSALRVFGVTFPVIVLGSMQALDGVAARALDTLRPALSADEPTVARLRQDLQRTPILAANVAGVLGIVVAVLSVANDPVGYDLGPTSAALDWTVAIFIAILTIPTIFAFLAHAIHQLRIVARVHRDLIRIDLFHLDPLYSFSSLTARTGAAIVGFVVYGIGGLSLLSGRLVGFGAQAVVGTTTVVILLLVAIACFLVPLLGLHGQIRDERDRRRAEANAAVDGTVGEIEARIAAREFDRMGPLADAMTASTAAVAAISRISTWPWRPETLRGFISALGLPILIWTITALLARVLPR